VQKFFAVAVVAFGAFGVTQSAVAADEFFLEIGNQGSSEYVSSEWQELSTKYKKLLGDLKLYPKQVTNHDGETAHVIQTGPISKKDKAEKICKKLFAKNISCFVMEGAGDVPPSKSSDIGQFIGGLFGSNSAPSLPWIDSTPQVLGQVSAPSNVAEEPQAIAEKPSEKSLDAAEGKVDVAQAIPVPLSVDKDYDEKSVLTTNNTEKPEKPALKSVEKTIPAAAPYVSSSDLSPIEFTSASAGWLDVSSFSNEKEANKFWNDARSKFPDLTAGLRVRIQKTLQATAVHLSFGPFPSGSDASSFCTQTIKSLNSKLSCHFESSGEAISDPVANVPAKYEHSSAYEERRKILMNSTPKQASKNKKNSIDNLTVVTHENGVGKNFWSQVVIADSKAEATNRITEIQSANSDVLDGISSSVTSSPIRHAKYNARLGPLVSEQAASELCDTLQQRGIDCLVISTK